jgi:hypothetical protein
MFQSPTKTIQKRKSLTSDENAQKDKGNEKEELDRNRTVALASCPSATIQPETGRMPVPRVLL